MCVGLRIQVKETCSGKRVVYLLLNKQRIASCLNARSRQIVGGAPKALITELAIFSFCVFPGKLIIKLSLAAHRWSNAMHASRCSSTFGTSKELRYKFHESKLPHNLVLHKHNFLSVSNAIILPISFFFFR